MGRVLSLQCIALSCCTRVCGHWRLTQGWAFWWCGMYHAHVWVPLSDTLKWVGWHMGCPGAVLQLSFPLFRSCCSGDKLSSHASLLSPTASNHSGSCTGFSCEQQPFRDAGIFSSQPCISSDISITPFTGSSLLPLAASAAHTRHLTMAPESGWLGSKPLVLTLKKMRVVSTCGHVNDLFSAAG